MKEKGIFEEYLKKKDLKLTPQRETIVKEVFSLHGHFDVEKLFARLRKKRKDISRATIYRVFPLLIESGLIKETVGSREKVFYEHIFGHFHHDHLICVKCGKIIEFKDEQIESLQNKVCKKYGFQSVEHRLGIRGYCKKCK